MKVVDQKSMSFCSLMFMIWLTGYCSLSSPTSQLNKKIKSKPKSKDVHGTDISKQIESLFRKHTYELSIRPDRDSPTRVGLGIIIESITDISEKNMDLTFTLCLHETWMDKRLKFKARGNVSSIVLPSRLMNKIWVPDLYVVGSKNSFIHTTTVNNVVMRLFNDGTIFHTLKITSTVACQMSLYYFPLDIENCSLILQSLGYSNKEILLHWTNQSKLFMDVGLVNNMPKYQLIHHKFHELNASWTDTSKITETFKSRLQITFELRRYPLAVFFQSYFPALAMVLLAGLGMWIDPKSAPARVSLGVTSVLTISTIINGLKAILPKVSYLTAMDIYLWVCFIFVFSTVLEFCVLNYLMHKQEKFIGRRLSQRSTTSQILSRKTFCLCDGATGLDVKFRICYFTTFLVFNIIYWTYYTAVAQHDEDD
ncbi:gamma-aminobutyric acid receptor subunit rho-2-like [Clavelina lepadiformis]|uniref:gamma-aminobutyric acid receptor subunit rho-2-like n=1 Tax=Clavelina lepadiformis TaxID=159417 RepID=UPI0040420E8E